MAANNLNGDHNNFEIFRQFAQGIDAILKLFLQNLSQAQTKDFTNKKVDELKNFNQLLYQAAEFGAYLEKIIQKQIQQAYYETKLEDFRMMEKEIENTLKEKQKNQLAADDPLVSQFKNLLIQEYNNRLNEINNKIEKVRENIALLDQKITEKYAQIKDDNKLILNNFQILFSQAMQHLSDNPSILIFQIDGEETKVNHNHFFDELQKYIDTNYESITEKNMKEHIENFSVLYMAQNFSNKPQDAREKIAQKISQALPNLLEELQGYSNLINSMHTRDIHVTEVKIFEENKNLENQALNILEDSKNLLLRIDNIGQNEAPVTLTNIVESRNIFSEIDNALQNVFFNEELVNEFLKSTSANIQQAVLNNEQNINAELDINPNLDAVAYFLANQIPVAGLDINEGLNLDAGLDLNDGLDLNAGLDLDAPLDIDAPLDLNGDPDQIPDVAPPAYGAEPPEAPPLNINNAPPEAAPPVYSAEPEPIPRQSATAKIADLLKIKISDPANQARPVAEAAAAGNEQKPPSYEASRRNNNAPAEPQNNPDDQPPSYSPRNR